MNKKLHFMHIGKTGGASLSYFLEKQFKLNEICPYFYLDFGPSWRTPDNVLTDLSDIKLKDYKLFKGHLGWIPRTIFNDDEIETITFLRDPVARTVSLYNYLRGNPLFVHEKPAPWTSFEDFIYDPTYKESKTNHMTKAFCMDLYYKKAYATDASPNEILKLAIERLNQCAFVGLTEQYDESFQWLCMQYDWLPSRQAPKRNTSVPLVRVNDLSKPLLNHINDLNQLDRQLYEEGQKVFSERSKTRVHYHSRELKDRICKKMIMDEVKFTFSDNIVGDGWDEREGSEPDIVCWTLATQSTLIFSVKKQKHLLLSFCIAHWLLPQIQEKLSISVNSYPISLNIRKHTDGSLVFSGLIPTKALYPESPLLELTFTIPELICPKAINPESTDSRELGFACKEVSIKPISRFNALSYRIKRKINLLGS